MSEFRRQTLHGISWSVASQVGRQGTTLVVAITLARLLSPLEFGLMAMVTVLTGFANLFVDLGFGPALIQRQELDSDHLSSVFWINLASGGLLALVFAAGSPLVAAFYSEPLLVPITVAVSSIFLFNSLGMVQRALRIKAVDFRTLAIVETVSVATAGATAIGLAFLGWGVWSLVAKSVLMSALASGLLWVLGGWRPSFSFSWSSVKQLLGFSAHLFGEQSMNYWVRNLDNLLIGRLLGSASLGFYGQAYTIMLMPIQNISAVVARVMFPSLSRVQDDRARVARLFLQMTRTVALVTFPLMLGLLVTAEPFVLSLLGEKWAPMIPILRVFCVIGLVQSVVSLVSSVFLSQGRADLQFRVGLITKPILITGIVIGLAWGVVGVAIGYGCAVAIAQFINLRAAGRVIGLTYSQQVANLAGIFLCAGAMAGVVFLVGWLLPASLSSYQVLAVQVLAGLMSFWLLAHVFRLEAYRGLLDLFAQRRGRRRVDDGRVVHV